MFPIRDNVPTRSLPYVIVGLIVANLGFFVAFREVPAVFFLGIWIGLQALDGTLSITTPTQGGGFAFFAHIGGFVFGVLTVCLFATHGPRLPGSRNVWR